MKTVQITFAGPKSAAMAKKFFAYLVDGGLEDQVIETLSGGGTTLEISDSDAGDLAVLFQCREEPAKRVARKGVR
jgi:hypothetical protein